MRSIKSKLRVNLSMIFYHIIKVNDEFIIIEPFGAWFYVTGHRIKLYDLIKCDELYLLTDVNDKFIMIFFHVIKSL
jgi:hypothetical protein